jgi:hypothetical protein
MDNLDQDFVTDARGMKRSKKLLRCFDCRLCNWTPEQNERRFGVVRAARQNKSGLEQELANSLKRDMHTADWLEDIKQLESRGHLIVVRKVWDGVKTCTFVELPDNEKTINLSANGDHYAGMNFTQAMAIANERVASIG